MHASARDKPRLGHLFYEIVYGFSLVSCHASSGVASLHLALVPFLGRMKTKERFYVGKAAILHLHLVYDFCQIAQRLEAVSLDVFFSQSLVSHESSSLLQQKLDALL